MRLRLRQMWVRLLRAPFDDTDPLQVVGGIRALYEVGLRRNTFDEVALVTAPLWLADLPSTSVEQSTPEDIVHGGLDEYGRSSTEPHHALRDAVSKVIASFLRVAFIDIKGH